jgi:hypothetical protein
MGMNVDRAMQLSSTLEKIHLRLSNYRSKLRQAIKHDEWLYSYIPHALLYYSMLDLTCINFKLQMKFSTFRRIKCGKYLGTQE